MKRVPFLLFALLATLIVVLFPASRVTLSEKTTSTVRVDCAKGDSINAALLLDAKAPSLTIEISGMCHENVVVRRDRVTLRGANPVNDGIQGVANTELTDATVWVREAVLFTIENLTLTGGFSGLLGTNANLPQIRLTNCRLVGNNNFGLQLENSLAIATDTTFESGNPGSSVGVFLSSRLACNGCTFSTPGPNNVITVVKSLANISESSFSGGPIRSESSIVNIFDSEVNSSGPGVPGMVAINSSSVNLVRVEIFGRMLFEKSSSAVLSGVTQTGIGMQPNEANIGSNVVVGSAGQPTGGPPNIDSSLAPFTLANFSNLVLNQASVIDGDLICRTGGNAHCANPANVTGLTNCGLCPKP